MSESENIESLLEAEYEVSELATQLNNFLSVAMFYAGVKKRKLNEALELYFDLIDEEREHTVEEIISNIEILKEQHKELFQKKRYEKKRIVILFSGNGSNLENLIIKLHNKIFKDIKVEVVGVITNNPNAFGIKRAKNLKFEPIVINDKDFESREEFDKVLIEIIQKLNADLTILAGFMRILTPNFINSVKAINIHPSLLPLFKGKDGLKESYQSPMKVAGVTVHKLALEVDSGEIVLQDSIKKRKNESFEEFEARIHKLEHKLYPKAIIKVLKSQ